MTGAMTPGAVAGQHQPTPEAAVVMLGATQDERQRKRRSLESELETVRNQKAQVLRSIQQIAKKQKFGGQAAMADTVEARIEAEKRHHAEAKRKIWQNCTRIMADLLKNQNTKAYFGEPVRGDLYPAYYETIKNPRDLGTIKKNSESLTHYKNIYEFRDDVRLCFENCRLFNPQGHSVRTIGDSASNSFEKKWETKRIEEEWEGERKRHELAMSRLEAEAKSLPDKIKEVDAELQALATKAAEQHGPKDPGPGRAMTFEEKRKLSHAIAQNVDGEQMGRILELIMESPSAPKTEGEEEVEVDIDALDNDTLWKIHAYVDSVIAEAATKQPPRAEAQQTVTATGETPTVDSNHERTGEANAEGVGSGSEGMASNPKKDTTTALTGGETTGTNNEGHIDTAAVTTVDHSNNNDATPAPMQTDE